MEATMRPSIPLILACAALAHPLRAQTVSGRVVDPAGNALASVAVSLSGGKGSAVTGPDGRFRVGPGATSLSGPARGGSGFAIRGNALAFRLERRGRFALALFTLGGARVAGLREGELAAGRHELPLGDPPASLRAGIYVLSLERDGARSTAPVVVAEGRFLAPPRSFTEVDEKGMAKAAAPSAETLLVSLSAYLPKRIPVSLAADADVGDVMLSRYAIAVGNPVFDKFDDFVIAGAAKQGLDQHAALIVKAMLKAESYYNPLCISFYDQELPCGTHSYGIIQLTPGCVPGFAALPAGTAVTATITGGVRSTKAVITHFNKADSISGNTIVKENGIIVDLVTNPKNAFWPTSAFNPEYNIANGARIFKKVLTTMKGKFSGCTEANYVAMALAGYNEGDQAVKSCTNYGTSFGSRYAVNVTTDYRAFCKSLGIPAVY
jgi:hypothetical protein